MAPKLPPGEHRRLDYENIRLLWGVRSGPSRWTAIVFSAGQRLLGGSGSAAPARAWYRRYAWAQHRRDRGTLSALLAFFKTPARHARDAWRGVHPYGPVVRDTHGVSLWTQRRHMLWLGLRHGFDANTYYSLWLYRPERRRRAGEYLRWQEAALLYRLVGVRDAMDDLLICDDKNRFDRWCCEHGLPTPRTLATFEGGVVSGGGPVTLPDRDLFSKPFDSYGGAGARRWECIAPACWRGHDGREYDLAALTAALHTQSMSGRVLLQECLTNHPAVAHLSSGALCTARIMTIRPPGGQPELLAALFRMATGGASTDNINNAGVGSAVDLATGQLGPGVQWYTPLLVSEVTRHPDTGATIPGARLPLWNEACALALDAHRRLPAIAVVGWDVAFTPEGITLVEANWAPSVDVMQASSGVPFGDTRFMRLLDTHLRRSFATEE